MKVIYDIQQTQCRYTGYADMKMEARLLGLGPDATMTELVAEVNRCMLNDYSAGRAVKGGSA